MEGSELTVLAALGTALATMVYFSWSGKPAEGDGNNSSASPKPSGVGSGKASMKKGKKRKTGEVPTLIPADDSALDTGLSDAKSTQPPKLVVQKITHTIPGGLAPVLSEVESVQSTGKKKKKSKKAQSDKQKSETPTGSVMLAPPVPLPTKASTSSSHPHDVSAGSESEWTNVAYAKKKNSGTLESASDTGVTTSVTEEEGSVASRKEDTLTSVEKLLPKPQKTAVDDMIDGPKPGVAHVLKIPGSSTSENKNKPFQGPNYDTYDESEDLKGSGVDADEEDSTWNIVGRKKRGTHTPSTYASDTAPSTLATASISGKGKNAKKNAKKKQAEKDAKEAAEKDRQVRYAKHARDLERAKIDAQYQGKGLSGGMQAKVDSNNSLIWD